MAEAFVKRGKKVTVIERQSQVLPQMDMEMVQNLQNEMLNHGIELLLGETVTSFKSSTQVAIETSSGKQINSDLVLLSIGVISSIFLF
jgi:pyruvate/2-oxoglutarate dehydrogenase complex dihydrolipoamide dehydrogenase (E3) component